MLLIVLSYLPAILGMWSIGLITLLKNTQSKTNLYFSTFTFLMGLWLAMLFIGDAVNSPAISLWAVRLATFFGTPLIPSLVLFGVYFPVVLSAPSKLFRMVNLALPAVFMALALTPAIVPAVEIKAHSAQPTQLGLLYSLQGLYVVFGFIFSLGIIVRKYRKVDAHGKAQIKLVVAGLVVALLVNVLTGFILTVLGISNNYSNLLGSVSLFIFATVTSYAIIKHGLFDIRLAIVRTVGFLLTMGVVGGFYTLLIVGVGAPLITGGRITFIKNATSLLPLVPPTIFVALTFHSIQSFIAKATRRVFYQDLFDLRTVMDRFSDALVANNDIDKIMTSSLEVIKEAIKPAHAYFVVFDDAGRVYRKIAQGTIAPQSIAEIIGDIKGVKSNPVVRERFQASEIPRSFTSEDIFLAMRLGLKDKPVGVLLFGPKQNGRTYTTQDTDLLRISANNLTIALENAKKYDQISHFADRLRKEVLKATADLREANDELKTLDVMKDDFISMASHQLRTPASSVHEALQMLNHSAMPLTKSDRARLEELAEASSEHLVTVVADMLSIARIQAGHFTVTLTPIVMQQLVERVLKQTGVLAEQKHVKLVFDKPKEPLTIMGDTPKLNEAISNYIENAIKYSPDHSQVNVRLHLDGKKVRFEVSDKGMGVPEKERKHLFTKFYRAQNAREQQPDGNGIGLFVVKTIATTHGGDTYYEPSEPGSTFGFWLPLSKESPAK